MSSIHTALALGLKRKMREQKAAMETKKKEN